MTKTAIWTIVIIIVIAAGVWFWMSHKSANAPTTSENTGSSVSADTAASMQADLNNIPIQDPNFQSIDQDTNSL